MLNAYCLVAWAMVEVKHEKGTHTRTCRMLHLDNELLKPMRVQPNSSY
jgi:hypothetical protein